MCWPVKIRGSRGFCLTVMESHAVRLAIMSIMRPSQAPNSLQPFLQEKAWRSFLMQALHWFQIPASGWSAKRGRREFEWFRFPEHPPFLQRLQHQACPLIFSCFVVFCLPNMGKDNRSWKASKPLMRPWFFMNRPIEQQRRFLIWLRFLVVGPPSGEAIPQRSEDIDKLLLSLAAELPPSKAAGEAARMTGGQKSVLYQRLMQLKAKA